MVTELALHFLQLCWLAQSQSEKFNKAKMFDKNRKQKKHLLNNKKKMSVKLSQENCILWLEAVDWPPNLKMVSIANFQLAHVLN